MVSAKVLANGQVLAGYKYGPQTYAYDSATNTWSAGPAHLDGGSSRAPWVQLRDGSILSYRGGGDPHAERLYPGLDPATSSWIDAGSVPVNLRDPVKGYYGPGVLLPDGRVFHLGSTSDTAIYTPAMEADSVGTWSAGPVLPGGLNCALSSAAMMPNGHVLFVASQFTDAPLHLFEFDPTAPIDSSLTEVTPAGLGSDSQAFVSRMVILPTGQVLSIVEGGTSRLMVYTPDGAPDSSWKPTVTNVTASGNNSYTLTGTQLTGISSGAVSLAGGGGDSNYPIVQLTNPVGKVYYARTSHWSTSAIATGNLPVTTDFALPIGSRPIVTRSE